MDPDMASGSNPGPGHHHGPGGKQATHLTPFLTAFPSSDQPLSAGHGLFCLSLPYPVIYLIYLLTIIEPGSGRALVFSLLPRVESPRWALLVIFSPDTHSLVLCNMKSAFGNELYVSEKGLDV